MIEYPLCKYCGASHGMGIETIETGEITPIDICKDCLFGDWKSAFEEHQITFAEWGGTARCMTSDGRNVNMAEELYRLEKIITNFYIKPSP